MSRLPSAIAAGHTEAGMESRFHARLFTDQLDFPEEFRVPRTGRQPGRLRRVELGVAGRVHGRAILGADVIALAHALGRVVTLPEHAQ